MRLVAGAANFVISACIGLAVAIFFVWVASRLLVALAVRATASALIEGDPPNWRIERGDDERD